MGVKAAALKSNAKKEAQMAPKPPRERLRAIRERSGISGSQVARDLGYASPPGYIRYEQPRQGDEPIPYDLIKRLIPLLVGRGNPPVTAQELLELTDAKEIRKPVAQAFQSLVDDGDGLLSVKYRVESGVFIRPEAAKTFGASRVGVSRMYPASEQFVAAVTEDIGKHIEAGCQLHCVVADQVPIAHRAGKRAVVGVRDGGLIEVRVGRIAADNKTYDLDGLPMDGEVLGIVIGAYCPE